MDFTILTINMAGLPPDTIPVIGGELMGSTFARKTCEQTYNLQNGQERRLRLFWEWLDGYCVRRTVERPSIICFQEIFWDTLRKSAATELEMRGYISHPSIAFGSSPKDGEKKETGLNLVGTSGLGIYVDASRWKIVDAGEEKWTAGFGIDTLTQKGLQWGLLEHVGGTRIGIVTAHPQAYMDIDPVGSPLEQKDEMLQQFRKEILNEIRQYGGYESAMHAVHMKQFTQVKKVMSEKFAGVRQVFFAADANVNKYQPCSAKEEHDATRAAQNAPSAEFQSMLRLLDMGEPVQIGCAKFSWDRSTNTTMAEKEKQHQQLDHILYARWLPMPRAMSTEVVRIWTRRPFPELSAFSQPKCVALRAEFKENLTYAEANRLYKQRYDLGVSQLRALSAQFFREPAGNTIKLPGRTHPLYPRWIAFIQSQPFECSSQVWKGLAHYGWATSDRNVTDEYFDPDGRPLIIGSPFGARMISDASDHHPVLARVRL